MVRSFDVLVPAWTLLRVPLPLFFLFSFSFSLGGFQRNVSVTVESGGIEERSEEKEFLRVYALFGLVRFSFPIYR